LRHNPVRNKTPQASGDVPLAGRISNGIIPNEECKLMWYTYILRSKKDLKFYTGHTNNLQKRVSLHNSYKVKSTKGRGPFEIVYYEACHDQSDALARERYLKTGMGKRYLKNRIKNYLTNLQ